MSKTFIYKVKSTSQRRGFNRTLTIYEMINNEPILLGKNDGIHTAAWAGGKGEAVQLIGHLKGYMNDGYTFRDKTIKLFEV